MIDIIIADDHRLLLEGLSQALDSLPDLRVVATASDGDQLVALVAEHRPDVVLLDIEMPAMSGIAALRAFGDEPPPPTIMVTMHTDEDQRRRAEAAGAVGFLSKATPLPDLAAAIRAVHAGERLIDAAAPNEILDAHRQPLLDAGAARLTARERELLRLLASGVSSTEDLADELYISHKTVKNHLASIYEKLAVSDRAQAAVEAIRLGLHRGDD
jgi:DNA-binding NarL/FixJ family response regulator